LSADGFFDIGNRHLIFLEAESATQKHFPLSLLYAFFSVGLYRIQFLHQAMA